MVNSAGGYYPFSLWLIRYFVIPLCWIVSLPLITMWYHVSLLIIAHWLHIFIKENLSFADSCLKIFGLLFPPLMFWCIRLGAPLFLVTLSVFSKKLASSKHVLKALQMDIPSLGNRIDWAKKIKIISFLFLIRFLSIPPWFYMPKRLVIDIMSLLNKRIFGVNREQKCTN